MNRILASLTLLFLCLPLETHAVAPTPREIQRLASTQAVIELPATAVQLLKETPQEDKVRTTIRVLRLFLSQRHSLAPAMVGALATSNSELAPVAAAEATRLFPELFVAIGRAATSAAPLQSANIIVAMAAAAPDEFVRITRESQAHLTAEASRQLRKIELVLPKLERFSTVEFFPVPNVLVFHGVGSFASASVSDSLQSDSGAVAPFPAVIKITNRLRSPSSLVPNFTGTEIKGLDSITRVLFNSPNNPFTRNVIPHFYVK